MTNVYTRNQGVKLSMSFDVDGTATDPDTITLRILKPDGTTVTKTKDDCSQATPPVVGEWFYVQAADQEGRWTWNAEGTGAATAAGERQFLVNDSAFA